MPILFGEKGIVACFRLKKQGMMMRYLMKVFWGGLFSIVIFNTTLVKANAANVNLPNASLVKSSVVPNLAKGQLYVFLSHSMGDESIKAYSQEAKKHHAILVMRGLVDDSFIKTKEKIDKLQVSYRIDPPLFEKYNVRVVPTIIEEKEGEINQVEGHISLQAAIALFHEEKKR